MLPVLRNPKKQIDHDAWKTIKLQECKQGLEKILPFADHEKEFLSYLNEKGEIHAGLLTNNPVMQAKIENLPLLRWKASLVLANNKK